MCGIYGAISFKSPFNLSDVNRSLDCLSHRGPDDQGIYQKDNVILAHRRLSIIDLSTGHQPIHNEDKTVWLICNGEIYNYRELTQKLASQGHRFQTKSDSEVIIHLYEQYEEDCVKHLNGIFAFALWDEKKKKLILGRDQLGVKPLFYYQDKDKIVFSSEIKAILNNPAVERKIDELSLHHFLSLNYVPSPRTMFQSLFALQPGHILIFEHNKFRMNKYWDVSFEQKSTLSEAELTQQIRIQLEQSVQMQLVSDVPVGAFLSGGLDSSAIVGLISKNSSNQLKTFNVRFKEESYDESSYARLVAEYFKTDHHEIVCEAKHFKEYIPKIVWHADNLTTDISMLPLYLVSKLAHEHVKVVLSGDGADELFAGYPTYEADRLASHYQSLPGFLKNRLIPKLINSLPVSDEKMSFEFKAKRFIHGARLPAEEAHYSWRYIFSEEDKKQLLINHTSGEGSFDERYYTKTKSWDSLSRFQYADLKGWMVDSILSKVDSMSMAHALEVRVPFLNHKFVEFAASIPSKYKHIPKYILKKALADLLPSDILKRKKAGFNIPIGKWFRGELKTMLTDIVNEKTIKDTGLFHETFVKQLLDDHFAGKKDNSYKLLSLLHFCIWHDTFVKGK
jgi:asparagine synthase (glutamine-hydrolysing)